MHHCIYHVDRDLTRPEMGVFGGVIVRYNMRDLRGPRPKRCISVHVCSFVNCQNMFAYQAKSEDIGDQGVMSVFSGAEDNMNDFRGCRPSLMFLIGSCEAKELLQDSALGQG